MSTSVGMPHRNQPVLRRGADPANAEGALIMIHGRGATAESILGLTSELDTAGLAVVAPQAEGNVWYPQSFLARREVNQAGIDGAFAVLDGLIDELAASGVSRERATPSISRDGSTPHSSSGAG